MSRRQRIILRPAQQLALGGPESAVLVACDQEGFIPFTFTDLGMEWIGCQAAP
jgi:hypothetical protein